MNVIYSNLQGWPHRTKGQNYSRVQENKSRKCKAIIILFLTLVSASPYMFAPYTPALCCRLGFWEAEAEMTEIQDIY